MKKFLIAITLCLCTMNASAEEVVKTDNKNKCQVRLVEGDSTTAEIRINEYLAQGYDLIKISRVNQFIFAKNCNDQIKISNTEGDEE